MHISITGDLGSGKSTVAKEICRLLGFQYISTGQIQRKLAQDMGMNTLEFNKYTDQNLHIDDYIDNKIKELNEVSEPHVMDSRLAWHFVNSSFKIYLMALDEVAAMRVLHDQTRIGEPDAADVHSKIKELRERRESENQRFEKNYGVKPHLFQDFDAIVDTSSATIDQVTQLLVYLYKGHQMQKSQPKIWLSPQRILPTRDAISASKQPVADIDWIHGEPVPCVLHKREFYVHEANKTFISSCRQHSPFIPVVLLARDGEDSAKAGEFVHEQFTPDMIDVWEKIFDLKLIRQPLF